MVRSTKTLLLAVCCLVVLFESRVPRTAAWDKTLEWWFDKEEKVGLHQDSVEYVNLHFPTNPYIQGLYEKGLNGGYKHNYWRPHYGIIKNRRYPIKMH